MFTFLSESLSDIKYLLQKDSAEIHYEKEEL